jgi:surfactin synthase thioesterase subunit
MVNRLERDLVEAPSSHSLFRVDILAEGGVKMPLMVCGSQDDPVIGSPNSGWSNYLKPADATLISPNGGHFFHHFYSELVSDQIQQFWQKLEPSLVSQQLAWTELN